ncbi:uncharacterized protein LOC104419321 [Eucalyptus grandis]|uniref:uncharacterized protein LOC104419321 n=1 Tax=Eucalyptus grandis TaxID=71139 RepID=UPI00192EE3ED|nr:uncharacterized protein LOC104419321 [Eucalyptus grandis]
MEEAKRGLFMCSAARSTKCGDGGGELDDDPVPTLLFTAGTALAVLGLKRAVLAFLGKQCWHVWWVFVLLNVILLVVFFTSRRSSSTTPGHRRKNQESEPEDDGERTSKKQQRKRKSRRCSRSPAVERARGEREESVYEEKDGRSGTEEQDAAREDDQAGAYEGLSDEELNEKVESFIVTFRQHLVSDARRR